MRRLFENGCRSRKCSFLSLRAHFHFGLRASKAAWTLFQLQPNLLYSGGGACNILASGRIAYIYKPVDSGDRPNGSSQTVRCSGHENPLDPGLVSGGQFSYIYVMKSTSQNLKKGPSLRAEILQSLLASFKIEGIDIPLSVAEQTLKKIELDLGK
jgi:hypothetical protein